MLATEHSGLLAADALGFSHPRLKHAFITHPAGKGGIKTYLEIHPNGTEVFVGRRNVHQGIGIVPAERWDSSAPKRSSPPELRPYESTVAAYDIATGKRTRNFVVRARSERIVSCYDADLSADGKYLAITTSGSGQEAGQLLLYDVASQRLVAKCFGGGHRGVAFIGSPLRLVSAGWAGGTTAAVLITAVPSGRRLDRITFPQMNINSNHAVVSSEDGEHFAVGRSLWNSRTLRKNFGGRKRGSTDWTLFSVAPDGTSLLAGELSQLELWSNRESKSIDLAAKGGRKAGAIAPNGRLAAVAIRNAVYILDLQSYAPLEEVAVQNRDVCAVRFSSDGRFMATASDDGSTCIWDISDLIATQE